MTERLESRIAVVESKVEDLEHEHERTRGRLHDLESGWATIRVLVEGLAEIRADVKQLLLSQAGDRAVVLWRRWAIGTGIALAGAIAAFLYVAIR